MDKNEKLALSNDIKRWRHEQGKLRDLMEAEKKSSDSSDRRIQSLLNEYSGLESAIADAEQSMKSS